jgi:Domain of unknown function (DUF1127)
MACGSNTCESNNSGYFAVQAPASRLARIVFGMRALLRKMQQREIAIAFEKARQRNILMQLDDRLLSDIGVSREEAMREARKPFWK